MAYLVLARKYRPRNFSEMVGQEHVVQALSNALTSQRLHHAYLFTGTRGVGKTTVSRILAKSLNCQGPDGQGGITATPCGVCSACVDIDAGRFVDYTELDAASNRGVDEVQSLLEQAVYKPVQGRFKVFMIDEVHMLTNTAFNAMLKTLEEPPEYLKFVLATTDPQKVPVTVLSRCLQFNLRPMAPETMLEHLTQVLSTEQVEAEQQALRLIARAARGSMRDALSLTDQAIAFGNGTLLETGVRQMLGSVDRSFVFGLIEALAQSDGLTVVQTSEALRRDGLSAASTLEEMATVLQAMAVLQAVPARAKVAAAAAVEATDPDAAETARLALLMPADETQLLYSICLQGRAELGLAPDEYAGLTMVLLRLLAFKPSGTVIAKPVAVEKKTLIDVADHVATTPGHVKTTEISVKADEPRQRAAVEKSPESHTDTHVANVVVAREAETIAPAVSVAPPGQRLAVVTSRAPAIAGPGAPIHPAPQAASIVAVPLRVQPPVGARETASRQGTGAVALAPIAPSEEGDFWHQTVGQLVANEAVTAMARELALQSQLVARDVDQWLLRVERETLNATGSRDRLQAALLAVGHEVRLVVEVGIVIDSPARRNALAAAERQRVAEEAIHNDPLVQDMMRNFGAKIVPGSLRPE
jgi:DNA polymerase-3 subunit gamma/tau